MRISTKSTLIATLALAASTALAAPSFAAGVDHQTHHYSRHAHAGSYRHHHHFARGDVNRYREDYGYDRTAGGYGYRYGTPGYADGLVTGRSAYVDPAYRGYGYGDGLLGDGGLLGTGIGGGAGVLGTGLLNGNGALGLGLFGF